MRNRHCIKRIFAAVSLSAMICGCSANYHAVYRNEPLTDEIDGGRGVFLDATQRAIFTSPVTHPSANMDSRVIVCAEPSPDAIMAVSQQFAAAMQASYVNFSGDLQAQGQLAEAVSQLGQRTASIQLLRDAYYRLCEARMDGFITNGTYPVAMNRLSDAMVALLAIEHLTSPNAIVPTTSAQSPTLSAFQSFPSGAASTSAPATSSPVATKTSTSTSTASPSASATATGSPAASPTTTGSSGGSGSASAYVPAAVAVPAATASPSIDGDSFIARTRKSTRTNQGLDRGLPSQMKRDGLMLVSMVNPGAKAAPITRSADGAATTNTAAVQSASARDSWSASHGGRPTDRTFENLAGASPAGAPSTGAAGAAPAGAPSTGTAPSAVATVGATVTSNAASSTDVGVGVNAVTAAAVSHITSIYQFKNLDETCLTLAGTALQVEFQIFLSAKTSDAVKQATSEVQAIEDENTEHIWRYCNRVIEGLQQNSPPLGTAAASSPPPAKAPLVRGGPGTGYAN